jgi:hypothetical protein
MTTNRSGDSAEAALWGRRLILCESWLICSANKCIRIVDLALMECVRRMGRALGPRLSSYAHPDVTALFVA